MKIKWSGLLFVSLMALTISMLTSCNPAIPFAVLLALSFVPMPKGVLSMAISATVVDIRGKAYEPIIEELLFENRTVADGLISFETDVKAETIFTENTTTVAMQAYTSGAPTASGTMGLVDVSVTPTKIMYYDTFDMNTLRSSRFKRDMKAGAWNTRSAEFDKVVLGSYAKAISYDMELKFWQGLTAATQTAIAALTPGAGQTAVGAAEQTWAAAQTAGLVDGVVAKMIYNNGALGKRVKRLGTTISASNIDAEYAKIYGDIPSAVLNAALGSPYFFAPYSHKQFINIFNTNATYRDKFSVSENKEKYFYNGIEIRFYPLPENCIIAALPAHIIWCTDTLNDINYLEVNKVANNQDNQFIKNVSTLAAHVVNQKYNVLYLG